jgi:hypothetical protein
MYNMHHSSYNICAFTASSARTRYLRSCENSHYRKSRIIVVIIIIIIIIIIHIPYFTAV